MRVYVYTYFLCRFFPAFLRVLLFLLGVCVPAPHNIVHTASQIFAPALTSGVVNSEWKRKCRMLTRCTQTVHE